jgi:hypothetical protein
MPDITSTFFGLTIAFLVPGMVGLYSLKYWLMSTNRVFETVLTAKSNAGLFLMVILGALVLGLVVSAIRWLIYEVGIQWWAKHWRRLDRWVGSPPGDDQMKGRYDADRLAAYRAAVDETYRYHQLYGGLTITFPALFVGWLHTHPQGEAGARLLWIGFVGLEALLVAGALNARMRYHRHTKSIFSDP